MFGKVLVANRGEIAVRIMRALEELGVASVGVYSELDRDALHVRRADEAYLLGGPTAAESYLNVERILEVVRESGAEAVHPGYGFLAENAGFARTCADAGVVFIGPPAEAIEAMGSKTRARELMRDAGVPIVPGTTEPVADLDAARAAIEGGIGYPVAVKAAGGGGGKGFRVALSADELQDAFEGAAREGEKFFSDATVYLERYLPDPRHVEVQVLADGHGTTIHLGERDCSIQRRHQKLIEESPAPPWVVDDDLRERIGRIAVDAAEAVGYRGAGTVEGLLADGEYFFLEMNTRVQVEHCVTEMTTGVDIVKEGIRVAAGEPLSLGQDEVVLRGHAIECRINAENAARRFAPAPGRIGAYREPSGPGVRVDSGVGPGSEVSPMYDPMVAKLIVWDADREQATRRMLRALAEYEIEGLTTLLPFHRALLATEQWARGETCRDLLEDAAWLEAVEAEPTARGAGDGEDDADGRAGLHGRGLGPALRRQGHRAAGARGRQRRRAGSRRDRGAPTPAPRRALRRRGRRGRGHARLAAPGQRLQGARRGRRGGRGGRARVRHRGDEDGERDHRPQGGRDHRASDQRGRRGRLGRHAGRDLGAGRLGRVVEARLDERRAQRPRRVEDAAVDGALGHAEAFGDLGHGPVLQRDLDEHLAMVRGQPAERLLDVQPEQRALEAAVQRAAVVRARLAGDDRRAHGAGAFGVAEHVAADREQPRAHRAARRVEALARPPGTHERLLDDVLGHAVVAQGAAGESAQLAGVRLPGGLDVGLVHEARGRRGGGRHAAHRSLRRLRGAQPSRMKIARAPCVRVLGEGAAEAGGQPGPPAPVNGHS